MCACLRERMTGVHVAGEYTYLYVITSCSDANSGGCHETVTQMALCSVTASVCGGDGTPMRGNVNPYTVLHGRERASAHTHGHGGMHNLVMAEHVPAMLVYGVWMHMYVYRRPCGPTAASRTQNYCKCARCAGTTRVVCVFLFCCWLGFAVLSPPPPVLPRPALSI